jgi:hypothetical protein
VLIITEIALVNFILFKVIKVEMYYLICFSPKGICQQGYTGSRCEVCVTIVTPPPNPCSHLQCMNGGHALGQGSNCYCMTLSFMNLFKKKQ